MKGPHLGEAQEFVRAPGTPKISLELATDLCNSPRADPNSMLK